MTKQHRFIYSTVPLYSASHVNINTPTGPRIALGTLYITCLKFCGDKLLYIQ